MALDRDSIGRPALTHRRGRPASPSDGPRLEATSFPSTAPPSPGTARPAGTLTSSTASPRFGNIGIAILDARFAGEGERVDVAVGDGTAGATVARNPLYDPDKRRVRS